MYRSFLLSQLAIAMLFSETCRQERTLYCNSNDPTSIRVIPRHEPFSAVTDSIRFYTGQTVSCLRNISGQMNLVQHKAMVYEISALRNNAAVQLLQFRSYYKAFCRMPCNDSIYDLYRNNFIAMAERLAEVKHLYFDVQQTVCRKNINPAEISLAIRKVSRYLNGKSGVFTRL